MYSEGGLTDADSYSVRARNLGKHFVNGRRPMLQLWRSLSGGAWSAADVSWVLRHVDLELQPGQALGIVGLNGAGKSTLLQLLAGTLVPSEGTVSTRGRVAALLELGSGFSPELSGRDNIYLNAAALGLSRDEIDARLYDIIEFSGLGSHVEQPVRTYSSGMLVRLGFSVATSVEPDILIIDEALSVGDGIFARKSFDRIQQIRASGATIIFCSHALYHIECFCDQALWLHEGRVKEYGPVDSVLTRYRDFLEGGVPAQESALAPAESVEADVSMPGLTDPGAAPPAEITAVRVVCDDREGQELSATSGRSTLAVEIEYRINGQLPPPAAAVAFSSETGRVLGTHFSLAQGARLQADRSGRGRIRYTCPELPLNRGRYRIGVYLTCERGEHVYHWLDPVAHLNVERPTRDIGYFVFPGRWKPLEP